MIDHSELPAPAPRVDADSEAFWAATLRDHLMLGYCDDCVRYFWYPRPICPLCGAFGASLKQSAGLGELYSFTRVRNGIDEYRDVPAYVLAYVRLDEGPCLLTNIVGMTTPIAIGDRVEVVFDKTSGAAALPRFRPVTADPKP